MSLPRSLSSAALLAIAVLAAAGCGSDDAESNGSSGSGSGSSSVASSEEIIDILGCEKMAEGQQQLADAVQYECEKQDNAPVYVYTYEDPTKLGEFVTSTKEKRADDDEPRGLAKGEGWVVDTISPTAIGIAEENGAEVVIPAAER